MKITTAPTINRLATVEEELTDRIFREQNGSLVFNFCEKLSATLKTRYAENNGSIGELREKLSSNLSNTLRCSANQAASLIELSLELVHTQLHGSYRRSSDDLSVLIATATDAVTGMNSN